jgi:hypothetical protein
MGEACGTLGEGELCTGFWSGGVRERDHWGDMDVDGKIILKWTFKSEKGLW